MKVLDIISEKLNRTGSNELVIFDIDDTLLHTTAKINVVKDGKVIRSLTNQEFNNYQLQDGEEFDFGEFRNAEKFEEESIPIGPMLDKLRSDLRSGKNVVMLTARADFDNQKAVWRTFKKHGIDINRDVHLYRAGNLPGSGSPAVKKAIHVTRWLKTGEYNKVSMYDDSEKNLTVFKSLEKKFPGIEFEAHHVSEEGDTRQIEQLNEKKKRRKKPRWAAYGPGPYGWYGYDSGYSGSSAGTADGGGGVEEDATSNDTVTRIDSSPIRDFKSNLKSYKHTDDWSQSGVDTGDDSYWKKKNLKVNTTKGLYAGDPHRTALYATGNAHETRYVEFKLDGQPIVYFDKKDLPKMRSRKTYLTVFDASNFKKLPTGEYFSSDPGAPLKQEEIKDPFQYIADQGWIVRITDDLEKVFKQVQAMHKSGKISQYGAEGMNESVAEAFGPLPKDNQQIRLGKYTVDIERVGLNKNYIGFAWHDSGGKEHYEEVAVGDLGSYDDLINKIKDEIKYHERKYTDRGVAENSAKESNSKYSLKNLLGDVKSLDNLSLNQLNKIMDGHVELVGRKFRSQEGRSFKYDVKLDNGDWYIMHVVYVYGTIDAWLTDEENNKIPLSKFKKRDVDENFADGKNPQDKGDSKRHGVPTKASVSTLRKVAKQGGRKGQLAHWMANMKSGRKK